MTRDLKNLGYVFQHSKLDAQTFLLRQRRTRVYGLGDLDGGQSEHLLNEKMSSTLSAMSSEKRFPFDKIFDPALPKVSLRGNAAATVQQAIGKSMVQNQSANIFVDTSTSTDRDPELAYNVTTCIRPSHPIYSVALGRYLTVGELFQCQGIFRNDLQNPQALDDALQTPSKAQDLAGNAFASTCAQVQLIASLCHAQGWYNIGGDGDASLDQIAAEKCDDVPQPKSSEQTTPAKRYMEDFFSHTPARKRTKFNPAPAAQAHQDIVLLFQYGVLE